VPFEELPQGREVGERAGYEMRRVRDGTERGVRDWRR
jgi:hypothetical protein